jgi:hypothetical protein
MLIVNSLNPPNRYGNIAVTRVLFIFEKKCTMSLVKSIIPPKSNLGTKSKSKYLLCTGIV